MSEKVGASPQILGSCPVCGGEVWSDEPRVGLRHPGCKTDEQRIAELEQQASSLKAVGDQLQSTASRMAEFILRTVPFDWTVDYEVRMAALEAQSAVEEWTAARVSVAGGHAKSGPEDEGFLPGRAER